MLNPDSRGPQPRGPQPRDSHASSGPQPLDPLASSGPLPQTSRSSSGSQGAYPPEDDFHLRLYRAFHAQRTFLRAGHRQTGLGSGQPKLFAYIAHHDACTQRDLARYFNLDAAGVCRMLDALERNGFISSALDITDRRMKHLHITERGKRSLAIWEGHCRQLECAMLAGFTPEEQAQFERFLERAYLNLQGRSPSAVAIDGDAPVEEGAPAEEGAPTSHAAHAQGDAPAPSAHRANAGSPATEPGTAHAQGDAPASEAAPAAATARARKEEAHIHE